MSVSTLLILFVIVLSLIFTYAIAQLVHDTIDTQELHHDVRVRDKQVETGEGMYPVTTYNGYGYTTRYVNTTCTKYKVTFECITDPNRMEQTLFVSKKQYDQLNKGDLGSLWYYTGVFKRFDKHPT